MYYKTIFIICNLSVLINVFFYEASLGRPWTTDSFTSASKDLGLQALTVIPC